MRPASSALLHINDCSDTTLVSSSSYTPPTAIFTMQFQTALLLALASCAAAVPIAPPVPQGNQPSLENLKNNPIVSGITGAIDAAGVAIPPLGTIVNGISKGANLIGAELGVFNNAVEQHKQAEKAKSDAALDAAQKESAEYVAQHPELQHDPTDANEPGPLHVPDAFGNF
ncbi:hypothetical protein PWT90_10512 [Aphanocladium album]|nr:hypothetical protein PWT90_10512 [Aphanocladium album]